MVLREPIVRMLTNRIGHADNDKILFETKIEHELTKRISY